jgi:penicillin-binding protein 1A
MDLAALKIPDLVAFNHRVHRRIDPWFEKTWVRRVSWGAIGAFFLGTFIFIYFAAGLPSSEKLLSYQPPLPTNVRGYDGNPVQTFARERRVELAFDEYPPLVVEAFISAEDKTFFEHGGLDYPGLVGAVFDYIRKSASSGGRARGGSTITQPVAKYLLQDDE